MRKTKQEADETKKKLLLAAYNIFSRDGFDKSSLENIAAEAGMTRGALYWHFTDKNDLYKQTLTEVLDQFLIQRKDIMNDDTLSTMEKLLRLYMIPVQSRDMYRFVNGFYPLLSEYGELQEIADRMEHNRKNFCAYLMESIIDLEQRRGIPYPYAKEDMVDALFMLLEGLHLCNLEQITEHAITESKVQAYLQMILG